MDRLHPTRRGLARGMIDIWPLALSALAYGVAFGALASQAGLSGGAAVLMSAVVFGGSAQMVVLQVWADPVPYFAVWMATMAMQARYILESASLAPSMGSLKRAHVYPALFLLTDGNWTLMMREQSAGRSEASYLLPYLVGGGLMLYVCWIAATWVGHSIGALIAEPRRWGLDFMLAAFCVTMAVALWRGKRDLWPIGVAAAVAIVFDLAGLKPWHALAGALAGSIAGMVRDDAER